jgi:hypothetical protein
MEVRLGAHPPALERPDEGREQGELGGGLPAAPLRQATANDGQASVEPVAASSSPQVTGPVVERGAVDTHFLLTVYPY